MDKEIPNNIVHAILASKLPSPEKELGRVFDDLSTAVGAGIDTTAGALRLILFHVFSNTNILQRLRAELKATGIEHPGMAELRVLEQLPYLTAVLKEGLRLSPAVATRSARVAPDRDLFYNDWRIPAGTPVGMTALLIHTDETLYPDPMRFNPDRWVGSNTQKTDQPFYPFSKGTRSCVGM